MSFFPPIPNFIDSNLPANQLATEMVNLSNALRLTITMAQAEFGHHHNRIVDLEAKLAAYKIALKAKTKSDQNLMDVDWSKL